MTELVNRAYELIEYEYTREAQSQEFLKAAK